MFLEIAPWQLLIITGAILSSIGQIFNKYQVHKAASLQVTTYKYTSSSLLITIFWLITNGVFPKYGWLFLIYGMSTGFVVTLYTKASRYSLSKSILTAPISQVLGIGMAAVVLGEWVLFNATTAGGRQMILALLLVPILMGLFYEKTRESKQWSILIIITTFWLAATRLFQKYFLYQVEPAQLLMLQYWGSLIISLLGLKWKGHKVYIGKRFAVTGLIQGLFTSTAVLLLYAGLKRTSISQTSLLRMPVIMILTTFFGLFIFKEIKEMTIKKWLGIGVAMIMAVLVVTANH